MDNPGYIGLTRMKGLSEELRVIANNIANASTTGFRAESVVFAEVLQRAPVDGGALAMASPRAHVTDSAPGGFTATGGKFDLAIDGPGYFQVDTPGGPRLTRAGAFATGPNGDMLTPDGHRLLDSGGSPVAIPPTATSILIGEDGTISADGVQVGQIGLFDAKPQDLLRESGVLFKTGKAPAPAADSRMMQGFVEQSNVNPITELARMIDVQRAYELGQSFLDLEDTRIREAVRTLGQT